MASTITGRLSRAERISRWRSLEAGEVPTLSDPGGGDKTTGADSAAV